MAEVAVFLLVLAVASTVIFSHGRLHADIVLDGEVAYQYQAGRGWTSYVSPHLTPGTRGFPYVPVYFYSMALWIRLFGLSAATFLSLNCLVVAVSVFLLWLAVARANIISSPRLRLLLAVVLPLQPALLAIYGTNRYDSFGMLGMSLAALGFTLKGRGSRTAALVLGGLLIGAGGGFQGMIALAMYACLLVLFTGWRFIWDAMTVVATATTAMAGVFSILYLSGTLSALRVLVQQHVRDTPLDALRHLIAPLRGGQESGLADVDALMFLVAVIAGLTVWSRVRGSASIAATRVGASVALLLPVAFSVVGRYSDKYSWLVYAPLTVGALAAVDRGRVSVFGRGLIVCASCSPPAQASP